MPKKVLVVLPAYRESKRLPRVLGEIGSQLSGDKGAAFDVHFMIVDDGSGPAECESILALIREYGLQEAVSLRTLAVNRGKGGAIRDGFEEGLRFDYDYLGFLDADGSVPVPQLFDALAYLRDRAQTPLVAVVGSRVQMLGREVLRSSARHYVGRVFATFVSLCFGVRVYDSQCGLKVFKAEVLRRYIAIPDDLRWVWDTELILAMLSGGEVVHELPIDWREVGGSKVSFFRDPLIMLAHLLAFRLKFSQRKI